MKWVTQFTTYFSSSSDVLCCSALARAMTPVSVRPLRWRLHGSMNTTQSMAMAMTLITTRGSNDVHGFNEKIYTISWGNNKLWTTFRFTHKVSSYSQLDSRHCCSWYMYQPCLCFITTNTPSSNLSLKGCTRTPLSSRLMFLHCVL